MDGGIVRRTCHFCVHVGVWEAVAWAADTLPADIAERLTIAYEPIWAIGSGTPATTDDIAGMHGEIRALLSELLGAEDGAQVRILYGGSVKPANAASILALENVDGALVGGASLVAADFLAIAARVRDGLRAGIGDEV
mgnify:CR=1 FL=1